MAPIRGTDRLRYATAHNSDHNKGQLLREHLTLPTPTSLASLEYTHRCRTCIRYDLQGIVVAQQ